MVGRLRGRGQPAAHPLRHVVYGCLDGGVADQPAAPPGPFGLGGFCIVLYVSGCLCLQRQLCLGFRLPCSLLASLPSLDRDEVLILKLGICLLFGAIPLQSFVIALVLGHILGHVLLAGLLPAMLPRELRLQRRDLLPQLPDLLVLRSRGRALGVLPLRNDGPVVLVDESAFDGAVPGQPGELGLHLLVAVPLVVARYVHLQ